MTAKRSGAASYKVERGSLPDEFPTHSHTGEFWESLGRTVATFGFLEEILCKAIFAIESNQQHDREEGQKALDKWLTKLERSLSDPLGPLIGRYREVTKGCASTEIDENGELVDMLRNASEVRNVLCHGSWRPPTNAGESIPFFVNRKQGVFETPIDIAYLDQVRTHTYS